MWPTSVRDVCFLCRVHSYAFICGCVLSFYSHSSLLWSLPDVHGGRKVWPLLEAQVPSALFSSLNDLFSALLSFVCSFSRNSIIPVLLPLSVSHYDVSASTLPWNHSLFLFLPQPFPNHSSGVSPPPLAGPGHSWEPRENNWGFPDIPCSNSTPRDPYPRWYIELGKGFDNKETENYPCAELLISTGCKLTKTPNYLSITDSTDLQQHSSQVVVYSRGFFTGVSGLLCAYHTVNALMRWVETETGQRLMITFRASYL